MHRGGQLTSLSSWQITILPSLPRVHLVLPLLFQGRPAQLAKHLDQATPACSGAKLPGSQGRSPRTVSFFIPILKSSPLPLKALFFLQSVKWREDWSARHTYQGLNLSLLLPTHVAWGSSLPPGPQRPRQENGRDDIIFPQGDAETFRRATYYS